VLGQLSQTAVEVGTQFVQEVLAIAFREGCHSKPSPQGMGGRRAGRQRVATHVYPGGKRGEVDPATLSGEEEAAAEKSHRTSAINRVDPVR
jgi:hypothetical protein